MKSVARRGQRNLFAILNLEQWDDMQTQSSFTITVDLNKGKKLMKKSEDLKALKATLLMRFIIK